MKTNNRDTVQDKRDVINIGMTHVLRDGDDEPHQKPLQLSLIKRLFAFAANHPRKRNMLFMLVILRSLQLPLLGWLTGRIISGPIASGDIRASLISVAGLAALAIFTQLTLHFRLLLALQIGEDVVHDLRSRLFQHLMVMPISFFNRVKVGRLISRMTSDIEAVRMGVQNVFFVSIVCFGQMIVASSLILWINPVFFMILLGMTPVLMMLNMKFRSRFSSLTRTLQESFSRVTATLAESVTGIRITQGFSRQKVNAAMFKRLIDDHATYNMDMVRVSGIFEPLLDITNQIFIAIMLVTGGLMVVAGGPGFDAGDIIQSFFLAGIFFGPLNMIGKLYQQALTAMAGAERIFKLMDSPPDWSDPPDSVEIPPPSGNVVCRNISFSYTPGTPVLRDVSFTASSGETIAIVGETGSGKSTMVNLISKFYLPDSGVILIDGFDLRKIKSESWHRHMGIIQQQNFIFSGTIMENIRLGRPDASDSDVINAARDIDCADLIENLPDGFQTRVGEAGSGISLGQRQLVCFVRAMLADPRILILDEATSSVDTATEARIQRSLGNLLRGRTCFVIAHRLSTIRNADKVLVFDQGRIIEQGNHDSLFAMNGVYANLYRQFMRTDSGT